MPAPFGYRDLSEIAGSWPIIPTSAIFGSPSVIPGTVDTAATILGIARETSAGYTVNGRSFNLYVDGALTVISFIAADPHTLQDVVDRINTLVTSTVAFRDNGYLLLRSDTAGEGSSLRLETDASSSPTDVFAELGLFSETEAFAGDLIQAPHADPKKQVVLPGQLTMAQGESFKSNVFNRAIFQMGVNSGRNEGLLSKKRIAFTKRVALTPFATAGAPEGYQFTGGTLVYTGELTTPTTLQLEDLFAVLDPAGKELVQETEDVLATELCTFTLHPETGNQLCTINGGGFTFVDGDEEANVFVQSSDAAMGALQDVPLKILSFISATQAIVQDIDPLTGDRVALPNTGSISTDKVLIRRPKVRIDGIFDTQGGSRVENVQTQKTAPVAPTRVEKNNRIVVVGANFITDGLIVGDRVDWTGHSETDPYDNNAEYRVDRIIDKETIEVVNADWSPAFLNSDLVAGPGTIEVTTDGKFFEDPFIRFEALPTGAIPVDAVDNIEIVHLTSTTYRDATDDPSCFSGGSIRFGQEVDQQAQAAIIRLAGQSVSNINDILHGDYRINLEDVDYRLNEEHYTYNEVGPDSDRAHGGRHRDIRPDNIDMFPEVSGETLIVRGATGETSAVKLAVKDVNDQDGFSVGADGRVFVGVTTPGARSVRIIGGGASTGFIDGGTGIDSQGGDQDQDTGTGSADAGIAARFVGGERIGSATATGVGGVGISVDGGGGSGTSVVSAAAIVAKAGAAGGGATVASWAVDVTGGVGAGTGGGLIARGGTGGSGGVGLRGEATVGASSAIEGVASASGGHGVFGQGAGGNFGGRFTGGGSGGTGVDGAGGGGNAYGGDFIATGTRPGVRALGGTGAGTGHGVEALGGNSGGDGVVGAGVFAGSDGVVGTGGPTGGVGGVFTGGSGNSIGVTADGVGTAAGIEATGGGSDGTGGIFAGGAGDSIGLTATGVGTEAGIEATGGATGGGGFFTAGATSGVGVTGTGTGSVNAGDGVQGFGSLGGGTNHTGVVGTGGSGLSIGVKGIGAGAGPGLSGSADTGPAIEAIGGAITGTDGATFLGFSGVFRTPTTQLELVTRHQQNLILANSQITIGSSGAPSPDGDSWNILSVVRNGNSDYTVTLDEAVNVGACLVLVGSGSSNAVDITRVFHWEYEFVTTTTIRLFAFIPDTTDTNPWIRAGEIPSGNEIAFLIIGRPSVVQTP